MKKSHMVLWLSLFSVSAAGVDFPPAPQKNYFSAAVWQDVRTLIIKDEVQLLAPADISVDHLVIQGTLVTNGHQLKIDALRLTFEKDGKITAFTKSAQQGEVGGRGAGGTIGTYKGGTGGKGGDGKTGGEGQRGNENPSAMVIHAVEVVGVPQIDGTGQEGGKGGTGGQGGRGGEGGRGEDGYATCFNAWSGRTGGRGGIGGKGGQGGVGGRGGAPVPIIFVVGNETKADKVITAPGKPGQAGDAGDPGDPGPGGRGGSNYTASCFLYDKDSGAGAPGLGGPVQTENLGPGKIGALAPAINRDNEYLKMFLDLAPQQPRPVNYSFTQLETQRRDLIRDWLYFHWSRNLVLLISETWAEIQSQQKEAQFHLSSQNILDQILKNADKERAALLAQLWSSQFVEPIKQGQGMDAVYFTDTALRVGESMIGLLDKMSKTDDVQSVSSELQSLIESIQSSSQFQFDGALQSALISCASYIQQLAQTDARAIKLSPYYRVPVCSGEPNFLSKENIAAPILLFQEWRQRIPDGWEGYLARVQRSLPAESWLARSAKFVIRHILPPAFADYGFEAVEDVQENVLYSELPTSIPRRDWIVEGKGRLSGFKAPKKNLSDSEIARELRFMSESLNIVRGEL